MREKLFALSYCLVFFSPTGMANEIWPYYILFAFTYSYTHPQIILLVGYISTALIAGIIRNMVPIIDIIQAIIVMQTCFYISTLNEIQKNNICKIFKGFLFFLVWLVFPNLQCHLCRSSHTPFLVGVQV